MSFPPSHESASEVRADDTAAERDAGTSVPPSWLLLRADRVNTPSRGGPNEQVSLSFTIKGEPDPLQGGPWEHAHKGRTQLRGLCDTKNKGRAGSAAHTNPPLTGLRNGSGEELE